MRQLARALLKDEQAPFRRSFKKATAMINRLIKPRTMLDKAIALSLAAMLGMNVFVLSQQLQTGPSLAHTDATSTASVQA